ncbi:hypothetical protein GCM10022262_12640 [Georgenia daeguensis]|uniref:Uncharacterized protein n=1 Tax=Georgenia daeguensis TaxID=908355 RepID=A0ABP8ESI1_9MICO
MPGEGTASVGATAVSPGDAIRLSYRSGQVSRCPTPERLKSGHEREARTAEVAVLGDSSTATSDLPGGASGDAPGYSS